MYGIKLKHNIFTDMKKKEKNKILLIQTQKELDEIENYSYKYLYDNFSGIEIRIKNWKPNCGVMFKTKSIKEFQLIATRSKRSKGSKYSLWNLF